MYTRLGESNENIQSGGESKVKVKSVKITRSINWNYMDLSQFGDYRVLCFELRRRAPIKLVIS
jgi:hypothetical protein